MTDIAALTKNAHDTGFEQGSIITLQTVMFFLDSNGGSVFAQKIADASNDGTLNNYRPDLLNNKISEPITEIKLDPTELGSPKMSREEATGKGFTGNMCSNCGSMEMQVAGHCEVCSSCGTTTGCS